MRFYKYLLVTGYKHFVITVPEVILRNCAKSFSGPRVSAMFTIRSILAIHIHRPPKLPQKFSKHTGNETNSGSPVGMVNTRYSYWGLTGANPNLGGVSPIKLNSPSRFPRSCFNHQSEVRLFMRISGGSPKLRQHTAGRNKNISFAEGFWTKHFKITVAVACTWPPSWAKTSIVDNKSGFISSFILQKGQIFWHRWNTPAPINVQISTWSWRLHGIHVLHSKFGLRNKNAATYLGKLLLHALEDFTSYICCRSHPVYSGVSSISIYKSFIYVWTHILIFKYNIHSLLRQNLRLEHDKIDALWWWLNFRRFQEFALFAQIGVSVQLRSTPQSEV